MSAEHLNMKQFGMYLRPSELAIKSRTAEIAGGNAGVPNALDRTAEERLRSARDWTPVDTMSVAYTRGYRVPN